MHFCLKKKMAGEQLISKTAGASANTRPNYMNLLPEDILINIVTMVTHDDADHAIRTLPRLNKAFRKAFGENTYELDITISAEDAAEDAELVAEMLSHVTSLEVLTVVYEDEYGVVKFPYTPGDAVYALHVHGPIYLPNLPSGGALRCVSLGGMAGDGSQRYQKKQNGPKETELLRFECLSLDRFLEGAAPALEVLNIYDNHQLFDLEFGNVLKSMKRLRAIRVRILDMLVGSLDLSSLGELEVFSLYCDGVEGELVLPRSVRVLLLSEVTGTMMRNRPKLQEVLLDGRWWRCGTKPWFVDMWDTVEYATLYAGMDMDDHHVVPLPEGGPPLKLRIVLENDAETDSYDEWLQQVSAFRNRCVTSIEVHVKNCSLHGGMIARKLKTVFECPVVTVERKENDLCDVWEVWDDMWHRSCPRDCIEWPLLHEYFY